MEVQRVKVTSLIPDPSNARKHSQKNLEAIKGSLAKFGQQKPIVVDGKNIVIAGNGTLEAAKALGWAEIDVVRTKLDGSEKTAFAIADNRSGELAEWDIDTLSQSLKALDTEGFDLNGIGFDEKDLAKFLEPEVKEGLIGDDEIPDAEDSRVKPGDLWQLGNHRLLCGDSTNVQHVEKLMGGEKADMVFTSPPYDQQRDYGVGTVTNWDDLMTGVFYIVPFANHTQIFVNLGLVHKDNEWIPYWDNWLKIMSASWRRFGLYIWDQGSGLPGNWNGRLAPSFEFIFHFNKESRQAEKWIDKKPESIKKISGTGLRKADGSMSGVSSPMAGLQPTKIPDNIIRINRQGVEKLGHPAAFPVALPEFMANTYSVSGNSLYDPFLGSGSTLIACEKTNRRCFGMEIDPHYCAIILARWEKFTGKSAVKL